ncbi:DAK2 domain-containing protein [Kitasatospora purpeofusca]|uniref:DAK2 domain-containing protein n=1 Tax=Kitasatospora purpeofusca TaxID=67352 RepID=UPI00225AE72E|nr:DAK2 domain-containing protein [Kitasatospora purpeofusca]MCX4755046.1 DAK2 domain-containing protein [Kitasatospora purpeofusca]WSR34417.1 DAK2 domain-containing protein [Kitasatospora purpeofusca]WSR42643.1 DAK2 domain-containing protein [Kitasatospora purpeofusca]
MLHTLDAPAVRSWCQLALRALGQAREEIDALNVYPVPDGDTGTNLYLTVESAAAAVESRFADPGPGPAPGLAETVRAMARGALVGARGNSGVILAQWLRGAAETLAGGGGADRLRTALQRAADSAYQAVAEPVEGTLLTVARVAAGEAARAGDGLGQVAEAAHRAAREALRHTPEQLPVLAENGVVDAGGRGLVAVLGALADAVAGHQPMGPVALRDDLRPVESCRRHLRPPGPGHPAFEVIYLLDAPDEALPALRERLAGLGDSLVVGGGDGLWNVHVHVDDAGAAVEAGVGAGRPHQIRITHFAEAAARSGTAAGRGEPEWRARAVLSVVSGAGLAELCEQAGAVVLHAEPGRPPASAELTAAVRRAAAREVVLLLNDPELRAAAGAAADQLREEGVRIAVLPTRSPVQGLAALAVHEAGRRFDEDVVAMTSAAGATRYAELAVAEGESWTMAGVCQAGDVLGLIDGDVAVIGAGLAEVGASVLDRMLGGGGELVTLILGEGAPEGLAEQLAAQARHSRPEVDAVVFHGGQESAPLLIGVE